MDKLFQPIAILLVFAMDQGVSFPGGAPGCGLTPGHGREAQSVNTTLQYLGGLIWQITLDVEFKGIIINTDHKGRWGWTEEVFQMKEAWMRGSCVTHTSRCIKQGAKLIFVADEEEREVPEFTGFVVYNYSKYSKLTFNLKTERQIVDGCY